MATGVRVHTNPEVLRWARESVGLSILEASRSVGVKPEILEQAEDGQHLLTYRQARIAAKQYDRPFAALFLPSPPDEPDQEALLRTLADAPEDPWATDMIKLVRKIKGRQEAIVDLLDEIGEEPAWPKASAEIAGSSPNRLSGLLRALLRIPVEEQAGWPGYDRYLPLRQWVDAVENLGVFVVQDGTVGMDVMRGFVALHDTAPIVVVNSGDDPRSRTFTLLHELAHLAGSVIGGPGFSEWQCDEVAGEVLVPPSQGRLYFDQLVGGDVTLRRIAVWAETFGLTPKAAVVRLARMGLIGEAEANFLTNEVAESFTAETIRPTSGNYYRNVLNQAGPAFSSLIMDALSAQAISYPSASTLLNVKVSNFEGFRQALNQRVGG